MKRSIRIVLALSFVPSCVPSSLEPDDEVVVTGAVLDHDGAPFANRELLLIRIPDAGEILEGFTAIVASIGLVCLQRDSEIELCEGARRADTDAEGAYRFELLGSDTQGSVGNAVTWVVAAAGDPPQDAVDGPVVEAVTIIDSVERELPVVSLWRPPLTVAANADGYALAWDTSPDDVAGAASYAPSLTTDDAEAWRSSGAQTTTSWRDTDAEDFAGTLAVTSSRGTAGVESVQVRHTSQRLTWTPGDAVPVSRGDPCFVDREGVPEPIAGACLATDGDLGTAVALDGPACTPPEPADGGPAEGCDETNDRFVGVDLGAVTPITRVYVRGGPFLDGHTVEVAGEDGAFTSIGALAQPAGGLFVLEVPAGTAARHVRVRNPEEGKKLAGTMAELSVF